MEQFTAAYKDALSKYAQFTGRLGVGGYWRFVAVNVAITIVLNILGQATSLFTIVGLIYGLALLIPGLAAGVRRLHDTGRSGWSILIALIPIAGFIILIVWMVKPGDIGDNAYGAPQL
ncbi:MAG: DUF805 domain-containing protein [Ilumatobacteraceae bacterium]|nr:DUF805 domain-containing protein [Ilumatobacteraceae bacterium]